MSFQLGCHVSLVPWAVSDEAGRHPVRDSDTIATGMVYRHFLPVPGVLARIFSVSELSTLGAPAMFVDDRRSYPAASLTMSGSYHVTPESVIILD